ncbi:hypothetical protein AMATHDRAFT_149669 [Amanita thiersii Skay4041]|uniref:Rad60/SUMO-like domain-containing protein n=1 Tax=Amanita thiersii Skay4041 TaxID=703135 RepID=A0A2A9NJU8_9AGAR|nr:hypothetical protein AMATHDRAFT_149669 [Amanita thiersii Skay4041]
MSQDGEGGDVKPKLNLIINYEGSQITVKVKSSMKFQKIFNAAEQRFNKQGGTFRFSYEGNRVLAEQTPEELGMEDGDQIDAFLQQASLYILCSSAVKLKMNYIRSAEGHPIDSSNANTIDVQGLYSSYLNKLCFTTGISQYITLH